MRNRLDSVASVACRRGLILLPAVVVSLALGFTVAEGGQKTGPSFNCAKAKSADEKAICASPDLSQMDAELQELYGTARSCALMGGRSAYHDDQVDWLGERRKCASDTVCLRKVYKKRIDELEPDAEAARKQRAAGECPDQ